MRQNKTNLYINILISILFLLPFCLQSQSFNSEGLPIKEGEIEVQGNVFRYEKSHNRINIFDTRNRPIFQALSDDPNVLLLDVAYSRVLDGFVVFRLELNPEKLSYTLTLEGDKIYSRILENAAYPVYNPLLVENRHDDIFVLYVTDEPGLVSYDIRGSKEVSHVTFDKPIYKLKKQQVGGREAVTFHKFDSGLSIPYYFDTGSIAIPKIKKMPRSHPEQGSFEPEPGESRILRPQAQLDEKTIVGFGDSITLGKQNGEVLPYRGYVPRLAQLVNNEFYPAGGGRVVNEGQLAEQIIEGVNRFEQVIIMHQGKYLLFHEGTNDTIWDYSLETVYAYLDYMMETALNYGVQPIISTLIPRDPAHLSGKGIYKLRAINISDYIRTLAGRLDIPLVDFWNIFLYYQELGGFYSVMSDYVHPNDAGYQIMAEEWLKALLSLPPSMPQNLQVVYASSFQATLQWTANKERDFSHYILQYGYSADQLDHTETTTHNKYEFLFYPLRAPFRSQIYVRIRAVDQDGHRSDFTPIYTVTFQ